jgi:hypothetical protein
MVNPRRRHCGSQASISGEGENGRKTSLNITKRMKFFVDILERLNVLFSNNGTFSISTIDGCIQMKSWQNPELRLAQRRSGH